jgi:hypothetical protein
LALFGAPISHEDGPRRAVRAALGIQRARRACARQLEAERGLGGAMSPPTKRTWEGRALPAQLEPHLDGRYRSETVVPLPTAEMEILKVAAAVLAAHA